MKTTQKGFALIEGLLIVAAAGLIGGSGWYVWHHNHKPNHSLNTTSTNSSVSSGPNGGRGGGAGDTHAQTGPAKTEVYLITEWGLDSPIPTPPNSAALIQYVIKKNGSQAFAQFSTQELKDADPACSVDETPAAGIINRAKATDHLLGEDGSDSGETIQQAVSKGDISNSKKVGSYYYWFVGPQGLCGSEKNVSKVQQLQQAAIPSVKAIVAHLEVDQ